MRAGKASRELSPSATAHYYIRIDLDNVVWVDTIMQQINEVQWAHNNTVGQRSISKNELNKALGDIIRVLAGEPQ